MVYWIININNKNNKYYIFKKQERIVGINRVNVLRGQYI